MAKQRINEPEGDGSACFGEGGVRERHAPVGLGAAHVSTRGSRDLDWPKPGLERPAGLVLCGGASRRMGQDKALLPLGRATLVEGAARTLGQIAQPVWLACGSTARYAQFGYEVVLDQIADGGPLAGLAAGLERLGHGWLALLACDTPRVHPALFVGMLERARRERADACIARTKNGLEPLCGLYHTRCSPAIQRVLASGERRMTAIWSVAPELRLSAAVCDTWAVYPDCDPSINLNTVVDYQRELARESDA